MIGFPGKIISKVCDESEFATAVLMVYWKTRLSTIEGLLGKLDRNRRFGPAH